MGHSDDARASGYVNKTDHKEFGIMSFDLSRSGDEEAPPAGTGKAHRRWLGIRVHDSLAISIAFMSLLLSATTAYFQFFTTYSVIYRVGQARLNLLVPGRESKYNPFSVGVRVNFYNLGTRPVTIDDINFYLVPYNVRPTDKFVPKLCPVYDTIDRKRIQIFIDTYENDDGADRNKFPGFVIQPNGIERKDVVISPYSGAYVGPFFIEGLLCASIEGTDWQGNSTHATQEIALIKINAEFQNKGIDISNQELIFVVNTDSKNKREMVYSR